MLYRAKPSPEGGGSDCRRQSGVGGVLSAFARRYHPPRGALPGANLPRNGGDAVIAGESFGREIDLANDAAIVFVLAANEVAKFGAAYAGRIEPLQAEL